jgi:hypothetical protein
MAPASDLLFSKAKVFKCEKFATKIGVLVVNRNRKCNETIHFAPFLKTSSMLNIWIGTGASGACAGDAYQYGSGSATQNKVFRGPHRFFHLKIKFYSTPSKC